MPQKFFISFNSADRQKAHWIAWTLREAGHEVAVHDWEIPAGGNAPLWMNARLAWADRLIAVVSPDYVPARYSAMEWAAQIWDDPGGTRGSVVPVLVRPTPSLPPLLKGLSRIDLTNCPEAEARERLVAGVAMPAPPAKKPAFEEIRSEAPGPEDAGPIEKPTFVRVSADDGVPRWLKISAAVATVAVALFAGLTFFFGGKASERDCKTVFGGMVVCGDYKDQRITR
jgi:TIR domain